MKYIHSFLLASFIFLLNSATYSQDSSSYISQYPTGITLEYGIGNYAVTDEYISEEKYSGALPYYKLEWTKKHDAYVYQLGFEFRNSSEIENYNVTTNINQFSLNQGFLYSLPKFSLFSKDLYTYIGPNTELFFFYNNQNIAVSGFDYAQSFAALFSLGISADCIYPLSNSFSLEGSFRFSVLSLGFRMIDSEEDDENPAKLLTLFAGTNANIKWGVRYKIFDHFSMKVSYLFNFTSISAWDPLLSASDNIVLTATYGL